MGPEAQVYLSGPGDPSRDSAGSGLPDLVGKRNQDLKHLRGARKIVIFLDHFF